ncbi:ScaI family restriction endonuclease [Nevskia sp.]|uniref:ScaI family restriction endonuclease n=1 Tax=Nevskia sp. TaxID=1929292 RepID=UPI0025ECCBF0|nr:ScaI family restriction endonuclease [Nevskia sp.]
MISPYAGIPHGRWAHRTDEIIAGYPLKMKDLVDIVQQSWISLFSTTIGDKGFKLGEHFFPKPQIIAFFLHELIPLEFASRYPGVWRGESAAADKDIVYIPDSSYSIEIKTSSHPSQIFGNRSYAQQVSVGKKSKSGYYLAINFGKFDKGAARPTIRRIRFGWLDHSDWQGQPSATGQQARLSAEVERGKLRLLWESA